MSEDILINVPPQVCGTSKGEHPLAYPPRQIEAQPVRTRI